MATSSIAPAAAFAALLFLAGAASAQNGQPDAATAVDAGRSTLTIGAGGAYLPDYEGSDDYRFTPAAQARGSLDGFNFFTRGTALYVDLIREPQGESVDFELGPVVAIRLDRTRRKSIDDLRIRALGKLDTAIEVGGFIGIAKTGVITSDYDTITARVAYQRDVANGHDSYIITPAIEYGTPLSTTTYVGISASADYVGDKYATTYFGVTPAQSVASGLAAYTPDGGFKSVNATLIGAQSLSGDLRGGWAIFAAGGYTRMLGDFKRSPVVSVAGDDTQWLGAIGIAYTF